MPNLLPVVTQTVVEKPVIAAEAEPGITNSKSRGLPYFSGGLPYRKARIEPFAQCDAA